MSKTNILQKPLPEPISTVLDDNELRAYSNIAKKIDFAPSILISAQLRAFFVEKNIKIFDLKKVITYLDRIVPKDSYWYWRPLRKQDAMFIDIDMDIDDMDIDDDEEEIIKSYRRTEVECLPYDKEVPLRVLISVNDMIERFGAKIAFFINDYAIRPKFPRSFAGLGFLGNDPFIMVTPKTDEGDIFIFDVWDEPSFS